jgi:hypothetical protein
MSLLQKVLYGGLAVGALVLLIRGQLLLRWPRRRPADPPRLVRALGLSLLLIVASQVASYELHARVLAIALAGAGLLVVLVPLIVASRQGRI